MKFETQILVMSISIALVMVIGCTNIAANDQITPTEAEVPNQAVAAPKPEDYPVAAFKGDSLYQLLVAEVAVYRREFTTALVHYLAVAEDTKDPGVAARATRLAAYLKDAESELQAAQIWARAEPDNIYAHRHAADKLMRIGQLEDAILHMESIRNLGGLAHFEIFAQHAASLDQESKLSLLQALHALGLRHPHDNQIIFSRAVLLQQTGSLDAALLLANQLLQDNIETNVVLLKVNILRHLSRSAEAVTFLEHILALAEKPGPRLRLILARLLLDMQRLDDAKYQYEIALDSTPGDGNILLALALIAMEQQHNEDATAYLRQMLRWNRRLDEAHFYLGNLAELSDDYSAAIAEYKQVTQGFEYIPAQARIARLLIKQEKHPEMQRYMANLRSENPSNTDQLLLIEAQLLADAELVDEVFALLDAALIATPDKIDLLYFRGLTGQRFGRLDILERDLQRVIALEPDNSEALNALGYTLADQTNRYDEALVLIKRALDIKPNEAAFIDSMGWVLYRLKDFDRATEYLRRALELLVNDEVAAHLGEILWVKGERKEANAVWQKALSNTPDSEILKKVIERFVTQ